MNHRHGAQAEHSFLKKHWLLKHPKLVCNPENHWPRASKREHRNRLEKWNKIQGASVMPEGFAEWGMDSGKASCSWPPLLTAQYYKHHFTTATNISFANYLSHHQRGCTELTSMCFHLPGCDGGQGQGLEYSFEAHMPTPHLQHLKFLGDGITPPIHKHTQTPSPSTNLYITHLCGNAEAIGGAILVSAMIPQPFAASLPLTASTDPCCQLLCIPGKHRQYVSICLMC